MTATTAAGLTTRGEVSPLTRLADAARRMSRRPGGGAIIIVRGLGDAGIRQTELLASKLAARGRRAHTVAPPSVVHAAHRWVGSAALVVDLSPPGLHDGSIMAAHLGVPLIGLAADGEIDGSCAVGTADRRSDAIAVAARNHNDIALSVASVTPYGTDASALNIEVDHRVVHFRDARVDVRVRFGFLEISAKGPTARRHYRGAQCQIEPVAGRFLILRDGTPRGELRGLVTLRARTRRVSAHVVRP